jgi:hypothetical protein
MRVGTMFNRHHSFRYHPELTGSVPMSGYDNEQETERMSRLAEEKKEFEDLWREHVKAVLSFTRIDPKQKGQAFEPFLQFDGDATDAQVALLKQSNYAGDWRQFYNLWKMQPEDKRIELYELKSIFIALSTSTQSLHRKISYLEKDKAPLEEAEILKRVDFLAEYFSNDRYNQFDVADVASALSNYVESRIEWPRLERAMLSICVARAVKEHATRTKVSKVGLTLLGWILPPIVSSGIDLAIVLWAIAHLNDKWSILAIIGLIYVGITVPISIIYYGTYQMRIALKQLTNPTVPANDGFTVGMNQDLWVLSNSLNRYRDGHINLRLIRSHLMGIAKTDIGMPVALLTLIDRSIAKGTHHW